MGKTRRRKRKRPREAAPAEGPPEGVGAGEEASAEKQRRPKPKGYDWWRENLEAIIVAFILALIIRHFSVEAFEIPTGSMAPTLYGIHAGVTCPNCATRYAMGLRSDTRSGDIVVRSGRRMVYRGKCPECEMPHNRAYTENGRDALVPGQSTFTCSREGCERSWRPDASEYGEESVITDLDHDIDLECPICQLGYRDVVTKTKRWIGIRWFLPPAWRETWEGGHKILVNKFAYRIGEPRRWDVIVFHFDEEKNYIKRLLGLPGEAAKIQGGDLYVKPIEAPVEEFRPARKLDRPDARDSLWIRIADTTVREKGYNPDPAWVEVFEKPSGIGPGVNSKWWNWDPDKLRWSVNVLQPPGRIAALRFNRRCENYYSYNLLSDPHRPREQVGDKKVAFTVRPSRAGPEGWIGGEIRDGSFTYQFRIPVGDPDPDRPAVLFRVPTETDRARPSPGRVEPRGLTADVVRATVALPTGRPRMVEFENVDDRVAVILDGKEEILALEYRSGSPELRRPEEHDALLLASHVAADLEAVRVYRDIYYSQYRHLPREPMPVHVQSTESGEINEYFPCGDNSPSSYDGRAWGTVPERNLMGKGFVVFWPPWEWSFIH